jgi:hypothetical protein
LPPAISVITDDDEGSARSSLHAKELRCHQLSQLFCSKFVFPARVEFVNIAFHCDLKLARVEIMGDRLQLPAGVRHRNCLRAGGTAACYRGQFRLLAPY